MSATTKRREVSRSETTKVGRRGAIVIPAKLRRLFNIEAGSFVIAEASEGGILIRPAAVVPVEFFTPQRQAEFLLSSAVDAEDLEKAKEEVRAMGLDPDQILHTRPDGE